MKRKATILGTGGGLVALTALILAFFTLWVMFDPIGAQMANDADPFGTPPSIGQLSGELAIWLAVMAGGIWLWWRPRSARARRGHRSTRGPIAGDNEISEEHE